MIGTVAVLFFGHDTLTSFEALRDNREAIIRWRLENPLAASAAFMAIYMLAVAFSVPGAVWLTVAGGFIFGAVVATACVTIAATIGACAVFLAARSAIGDRLLRRAGPFILKMEAGFREDALSYLLVLRLIPLFPFWIVNLVPAFLGVSLRVYFVSTLIGIIPGTFVYALLGSGLGAVLEMGDQPDLGEVFHAEVIAALVGLAALSLAPVVYKKWIRGSVKRKRGHGQF